MVNEETRYQMRAKSEKYITQKKRTNENVEETTKKEVEK